MNYSFKKSKIDTFSIIYAIIVFFFVSCTDENQDIIPFTYVNYTIDLQNPDYLDLLNVSGSAYINGEGYNRNGIIVYRSGIDEFKAYDRTCTYKVPDNCSVEKSSNSIVNVICPCCDSQFGLMYGSVSKGPANYALKEYQTTFDGTYIRIFN